MRIYFRILRAGPWIYKVLIFIAGIAVISYLFPAEKSFEYTYQPGKPWLYADLYAPYDFMVQYPDSVFRHKQDSVRQHAPLVVMPISIKRDKILHQIQKDLNKNFEYNTLFSDSLFVSSLIDSIYQRGYLSAYPEGKEAALLWKRTGKHLFPLIRKPFTRKTLYKYLSDTLHHYSLQNPEKLVKIFMSHIPANFKVDTPYTQKILQQQLQNFNPNKQIVYKGERIVSKGEKITPAIYEKLQALKKTYAIDGKRERFKTGGFILAVFIIFSLLMIYFKELEPSVYANNVELSAIFLLLVLMVAVYFTLLTYLPDYTYMVPLILIPFILKSFFNWQISFMVSLAIILITSFAVPYPFEFIMLQTAAVWAAVTASNDLTRRSNMFVSAIKVVVVYMLMYIGVELVTKGYWQDIKPVYFLFFGINGFLSAALVHEIILIFEKLFGIVSDISLLELLNTDNKLLKRLAEKAPGTFQHSLQVANLSEAIANELNANSLLCRVGALYHDLGKMKNPRYFTENQTGDFNPHEDLPPEESARIIINHVIDGIEMARRNGIPEKVIDFIRTHHGTDTVQYFLEKARQQNPEVNEEAFKYPGPNPFSKETAIVMMADSVEAASKSLKNPTREELDNLVDKIIDRKLHLGLLNNAEITLKEIEEAKKVLKKKLRSIYHPRVEYPNEIFDNKLEKP